MICCKLPAGDFEELIIGGIRFAIVEPKLILFNASDDLTCVDIDSWFLEQLEIVWLNDANNDVEEIKIPKRLLDSPIVNGGRPWIVAIIEAACEIAAKTKSWEISR